MVFDDVMSHDKIRISPYKVGLVNPTEDMGVCWHCQIVLVMIVGIYSRIVVFAKALRT